jgi:hypothetical protein
MVDRSITLQGGSSCPPSAQTANLGTKDDNRAEKFAWLYEVNLQSNGPSDLANNEGSESAGPGKEQCGNRHHGPGQHIADYIELADRTCSSGENVEGRTT